MLQTCSLGWGASREPVPHTETQALAAPGLFLEASAVRDTELRVDSLDEDADDQFEPSPEPCEDDISWDELVFWLGDTDSGCVKCSCGSCRHIPTLDEREVATVTMSREDRRSRESVACIHCRCAEIPSAFYTRLAPLIPVIALPRMDGITHNNLVGDEW